MKKEIRDRWTAALRSGEYQQGRLAFERSGRFCCLGVLCDVVGERTTMTPGGSGNWDLVADLLDDHSFDVAHQLAALNDGRHGDPSRSFPEIADWIEQNVAVE